MDKYQGKVRQGRFEIFSAFSEVKDVSIVHLQKKNVQETVKSHRSKITEKATEYLLGDIERGNLCFYTHINAMWVEFRIVYGNVSINLCVVCCIIPGENSLYLLTGSLYPSLWL